MDFGDHGLGRSPEEVTLVLNLGAEEQLVMGRRGTEQVQTAGAGSAW